VAGWIRSIKKSNCIHNKFKDSSPKNKSYDKKRIFRCHHYINKFPFLTTVTFNHKRMQRFQYNHAFNHVFHQPYFSSNLTCTNVTNDKHLLGRLWLSSILSFLFLGLLCSFMAHKNRFINTDCGFLGCYMLQTSEWIPKF
jgi:hypothetical protein